MRCLACDVELNDFEATRKSVHSGQYVDLCDKCFSTIKGTFEVEERDDLKPYEEICPMDDYEHDD